MHAIPSGVILVGLTGGLATGKSTVARMFQDCGAIVLDADALARQVVQPGRPAWREIVREYGRSVLLPNGMLDRQALAAIVFKDPRKLRKLNAIIHPRVAREQARLTREYARKHPASVIIYDAPLLIEAGAHTRMDRVIVVTADQKTQIARLRARNHLSRAEALRRIRTQMPLSKKIKYADYVIDSRMPLEQLRQAVASIYQDLKQLA